MTIGYQTAEGLSSNFTPSFYGAETDSGGDCEVWKRGCFSLRVVSAGNRHPGGEGWSNPAPDEYFPFGYPQEIQNFREAIATHRQSKSGLLIASDTVAALCAAYVSAERRGAKVEAPFDPALG